MSNQQPVDPRGASYTGQPYPYGSNPAAPGSYPMYPPHPGYYYPNPYNAPIYPNAPHMVPPVQPMPPQPGVYAYPYNQTSYPAPYPSPQREEWTPGYVDKQLIEQWWDALDVNKSGSIGGAGAVTFLMTSNMNKDVLRNIWAMVDVEQRGSISKVQFFQVIRLMSISLSPLYASTALSMDLYYNTLTVTLSLPKLEAPATTSTTPAAAVSSIEVPSYSIPSQENEKSSSVAVTSQEDDDDFSDFATASSTSVAPTISTTTVTQTLDSDDPFNDLMPAAAPAPLPSLLGSNDNDIVNVNAVSSQGYTTQPSLPTNSIPSSTSSASLQDHFSGISDNVSARKVEIPEEDDDFSDFSSAPTPTAANISLLTPATASPTAMTGHMGDDKNNNNIDNNNNDDDDDFSDFSSAVHHHETIPSIAVTSNTVESTSDGDEIGDFMTANSTTAAAITAPISPMTSAHHSAHDMASKMSAFDDLVESDLQQAIVNNEEWDDFESVPAAETTPSGIVETNVTASTTSEIEISGSSALEDFGDFASVMQTEKPTSTTTASNNISDAFDSIAFEPNTNTSSQSAVTSTIEDSNSDFGDFEQPMNTDNTSANTASAVDDAFADLGIEGSNNAVHDGAVGAADLSDELTMSVPSKSDISSAFDDLIATETSNPQPAVECVLDEPSVVSNPATSVNHDININNDLASQTSLESVKQSVVAVTAIDEDPFAELSESVPVSAPLPSLLSLAITEPVATISTSEDDFGDFGDFSTASPSHGVLDKENVTTAGEDDFGDFGDFESSPRNATQSTAPSMVKSTSADKVSAILDLLDLAGPSTISTSQPSTVTPSFALFQAPVVSEQVPSFDADFSDFTSATSETPTTTHLVQEEPTNTAAVTFDASFDAFESAPITSTMESIEDVNRESQIKVNNLLVGITKPNKFVSPETLDKVLAVLVHKGLYLEACQCLHQIGNLQRIRDLAEEKKMAVENDDLEKALAIKKEVTKIQDQLRPFQVECEWFDMAMNAPIRNVKTATAEIRRLNSQMANKYTDRFEKQMPMLVEMFPESISNTPVDLKIVEDNLLSCLVDMSIIDVIKHSLNSKLDESWGVLLDAVDGHISASLQSIAEYGSLSDSSKSKAHSDQRLMDFISALLQLVQAGLWIAATCLETMTWEDKANMVIEKCVECKNKILVNFESVSQNEIQIESDLYNISGILNARKASFDLRSSETPVLCPISLRPLKTCDKNVTKNIATVDGSMYLKSAKNIWEHSMSSLPLPRLVDNTLRLH